MPGSPDGANRIPPPRHRDPYDPAAAGEAWSPPRPRGERQWIPGPVAPATAPTAAGYRVVDPGATMVMPAVTSVPAPPQRAVPAGGATSTPSSPRMYFPAIDGLRGAAVLSVLLYHTSWFSNGLFGVDIFMVLSGFLITVLLFREAARTGRVSLSGFYKRRFKRLMPGLSITLLVTVALAYLWSGIDEARQVGTKAIAALFQVANWQQILNNNAYWEGFGRINPLAHMWSLSITEQFYLAWPVLFVILFWTLRRSAAATTGVVFVLLAASAAIAPLSYDGTNSDRLYLGTDTRTVDFLAGAAAAGVVFLLRRRSSRRHTGDAPSRSLVQVVITVVGFVCLVAIVAVSVSTSTYHSPWLYQGGMAAVAVLTAVLIATLCVDRGPLIRMFSFGPLMEVGKISYTLYLVHLPIFWIMQKRMPTITPYALFFVGGGLSWLAAMLLHYGVTERLRLRPWRAVRAVPTAVVLATAISAGGYLLPATVEHKLNPGNRPAVLLLGDSLAGDTAEALGLRGTRYAAIDGSISGCGAMQADAVRPVSGKVWPISKECRIRDRLWSESLKKVKLRAVVAHFGWDAADQKIDGTWLTPCDAAYRTRYLARLDRAAQLVQANAPGTPFLIMNERMDSWGARPASLVCYNGLVDAFVATGKARLLDLNAIFCPPRGCLKNDPDGHPLYIDGVHFSPEGKAFVVRPLETRISQVLAATGTPASGPGPGTDRTIPTPTTGR